MNTMFCTECGTKNDGNGAFCNNCGTKMASDTAPANSAPPPAAQPPPVTQPPPAMQPPPAPPPHYPREVIYTQQRQSGGFGLLLVLFFIAVGALVALSAAGIFCIGAELGLTSPCATPFICRNNSTLFSDFCQRCQDLADDVRGIFGR